MIQKPRHDFAVGSDVALYSPSVQEFDVCSERADVSVVDDCAFRRSKGMRPYGQFSGGICRLARVCYPEVRRLGFASEIAKPCHILGITHLLVDVEILSV